MESHNQHPVQRKQVKFDEHLTSLLICWILGKRKEISPLKEKNNRKKTRSVSSLESIEEDHPTSAGADKADGREKRKLSLKLTKK